MNLYRAQTPWQEIDGQVVIIHPESNQAHELNEVASTIWKCMDDGISIGELADKVFVEFEADLQTITSDVGEFVDQLIDFQLVDSR